MEPLRIDLTVECPVEDAFRTWAVDTSVWWPPGHSVSAEPGLTVTFEPRAGGRIFERTPGGIEHDWGEVEVWDPPHRIAYSWHLRFDRADATHVEVTFAPAAAVARRSRSCTRAGSGWGGRGGAARAQLARLGGRARALPRGRGGLSGPSRTARSRSAKRPARHPPARPPRPSRRGSPRPLPDGSRTVRCRAGGAASGCACSSPPRSPPPRCRRRSSINTPDQSHRDQPSPRSRRSPLRLVRPLAHDRVRVLVVAQPLERRLAHRAAVRPLAELDLGDQVRLDELRVLRRLAAVERRVVARERLELALQQPERLVGEARPDAAGVDELLRGCRASPPPWESCRSGRPAARPASRCGCPRPPASRRPRAPGAGGSSP